MGSNKTLVRDVEEDDEILKAKISCHPLYGLLIETHLNCLKVSMGYEEFAKTGTPDSNGLNTPAENQPDLDRFMEVYCEALKELKQAMEDPVQDAMTFINHMYFQLNDLSRTRVTPDSTATSFGEEKIDQVCQRSTAGV